MARSALTVEEVTSSAALRRFVDLPHLLFHAEPRWSPPVAAWVKARLDPHRNPFFVRGDGAYFLARRLGRPVGRITAHVAADGADQGWFGFFDVADDPAAARALLQAAARWLRDQGCETITGPASFTVADEAGILVRGHEVAGTTGRWWHPPWYEAGLLAAGMAEVPGSRRATWRLPARPGQAPPAPTGAPLPALIGPYGDPRLALPGIVAVPDLVSAGPSRWRLARRARRGEWLGCTVVACERDPAEGVPALVAAASAAGYEWVVAPWSPDPAEPPETEHALFGAPVASLAG